MLGLRPLRDPVLLIEVLLAFLGCDSEEPAETGDAPECVGARDPATKTYEWVKIGTNGLCAGSDDGCVDCWGAAGEVVELDDPYRAFDIHLGLACGITMGGEPKCWSWVGWPEPPEVAPLIPEDGDFEGVEVTGETACWTRAGEPPLCPMEECDAARDPENPECVRQPASGELSSFVGADSEYCGLDQDGAVVCWGFQPGLALTRPASYVRLDAANTICGLDAVGTAWCSSLGTEMANSAEVTEIPGPFVQVGPGWRVLLLDASGGVTDLHYNWGGGTEFGYLCEIGSEAYTAVASYGQQSCALPVGGGIECWQENDAGCITGTPADLMYWD